MSDHATCIVYVAYTNEDLTEGKGRSIPLAVCELRQTALRLGRKKGVQGTDCSVRAVVLLNKDGRWWGPAHETFTIVRPSHKDLAANKLDNEKEAALAKAKELGLTADEIRALSR